MSAATPALRDAIAWCAFVERVWPADAAQIEATQPTNDTPHAVIVAHAKAMQNLADLRKFLYPEDDETDG